MKNRTTLLVAAAASAVLLGAGAFALVRTQDTNMDMSADQLNSQSTGVDTESVTYKMWSEMTGEQYDRNFLANMIAHHQGAVDMAKLAQANASHQELKDFATRISTAQEQEISEMLAWQSAWGLPSTSAENMTDHSAMGMMDEMGSMTEQLVGKTGNDFDRAFLSSMIEHHQSAIDMAAPGQTNAERQEIKDLATRTISDQTGEIAQMRTWQREWNYVQ